ncbi:MAG: hypothetical protein M3P51_01630, partial [Chloroflexota bacterium]|nr:hypothetical protein [Chloroflexota bacterium]
MRKLSELLKQMAQSILTDPEGEPSAEAAHAALLLAHVAWNRSVEGPGFDYQPILREFEQSDPRLWRELTSPDAEALIEQLAQYKQQHAPED